jgi:hypothetical protein
MVVTLDRHGHVQLVTKLKPTTALKSKEVRTILTIWFVRLDGQFKSQQQVQTVLRTKVEIV